MNSRDAPRRVPEPSSGPWEASRSPMPRLLHAMLLFAALAAVLVGGWAYVNRETLSWQWASYQVGAAASFEQARERIARFEQGPDATERLRVLAAKWGGGNPQFDRYLAQYAASGESSKGLRRAFSRQLTRRPELVQRWAHFWCWQASIEPDRQIESILEYLDALAFDENAVAGESLTWRELLDLQAIFALSGEPDRAMRVALENWREHYRVWREARRDAMPHVPRPAEPFPDSAR